MKNSFEQVVSEKKSVEDGALRKEFAENLSKNGKEEVKSLADPRKLDESEEVKTQGALTEIREKIESLQSRGKNEYFENLQKELSENPEVKRLYEEIILNEDSGVLKEKTAEQAEKLSKLFFKYPKILHIRYNIAQRKKLEVFTEYVKSFKPIRSDSGKHDEFKSPELTGNVNSYGEIDPFVKAERFVYASFDKVAHHMSGKLGARPNTVELSDDGFEERAQIVMNDIANVPSRAFQQRKGLMEKYLTNMFDYEGGKKILSLYLALVFDAPRDVEYTFDRNDSHLAQLWDKDDDFSELGNDYDLQRGKTPKEANEILKTVIPEKRKKFGERMKHILQETGIEPPLSLELRIRDSAMVKK